MNKHKYEDVRYKIDKPTNIDESLGYEGGMKGFGSTIIFVIVAFVIFARDIIDAGSFEESMEYVRIIFFVCFFIFLYNLKEYIYYKKNKNAKQFGIRVKGFISDISTKVKTYEDDVKINFSLIVEYNDPYTGKLKKYKTPPVNFDPMKELGSKECGVYIYKGHVFVSDFVKKTGSEIVFFIEDFPEVQVDNINKKIILSRILNFIVSLVIMFLIVGFISFLGDL